MAERGLAPSDRQPAIDQHSLQAGQFAERYRDSGADPYGDCFAYSRHRLQACLETQLPPAADGLRALDVGCGVGHHAAWLRQRGFEVIGIDGARAMLQQARNLHPEVPFLRGAVETLPFADASFDLVLCVEVLRYLPSPLPCLREIARVLRPGGSCLATAAPLFSLNGYWAVNRLVNCVPVWDLVRLRQFFTTATRLERDCRRSGFRAAQVSGVYFGPVNWLERVAPRTLAALLPAWEKVDVKLSARASLRDLGNMFLVRALR